jgi:hypothetical protein
MLLSLQSSASFSQYIPSNELLTLSDLTTAMSCVNEYGGVETIGITADNAIYYSVDAPDLEAKSVGHWSITMSDPTYKIYVSDFRIEGISSPIAFNISEEGKEKMLEDVDIRNGAISLGGFDAMMQIAADTIYRTWVEFEVDFGLKYYRIRLADEITELNGQTHITSDDCKALN